MSALRKVASESNGVPFLPDDIVIQVLAMADWKDVLSARQASTLWCILSKMRTVWTSLILREIQPTHERPALHHLPRPIHDYTTVELEELFNQWKMAEEVLRGARSDAWKPPRAFSFPKPSAGAHDVDLKHTLLLPGGRWLIVLYDGPNLWAVDLDAERPVPQAILTNDSMGPSSKWAGRPRLQSDATEPGKCLISFPLLYRTSAGPSWSVEIWQLETVSGHGGAPDTLSASLRTCLHAQLPPTTGSYGYIVYTESLTKDVIVLQIDEFFQRIACLAVVKWSELPPGHDTFFPRKIIKQEYLSCLNVLLLPNDPNHLLVVDRSRARVHNLRVLPSLTSFDVVALGHLPESTSGQSHTIEHPEISGSSGGHSPLYILSHPSSDQLRVRMVAKASGSTNKLLALEFVIGPHGSDEDGSREIAARHSLLSFDEDPAHGGILVVGYSHALAHTKAHNGFLLYGLPDLWKRTATTTGTAREEEITDTRIATLRLGEYFSTPLQLNEGSGRLVCVEHSDPWGVNVADIVL